MSTPDEQGIDSMGLAELVNELNRNVAIHSLLIVRNGYVVADVAFYPNPAGSVHDLASVTKSFTSTLVGIAIEKGHIAGVDEAVLDLLPNRTVANLDDAKRAVTLENLITMRSGFECSNLGSDSTDVQLRESQDWVQFSLDLPMATEPGAFRNYCNPNAHLASAIVQETTELPAEEYAAEHLFAPLGVEEVVWPRDPQGVNVGYGDLIMAPRDMAKLGYLFLENGRWDGQQVVSERWVDAATDPDLDDDYGYHWWLGPNYYWARGAGGQAILVVPDHDLVVVTTGYSIGNDGWPERILRCGILPLIRSDQALAANPEGMTALEAAIRAAAAPPDPDPIAPLPDIAREVDGKTILMDPNPLGLSTGVLVFPNNSEAVLTLSFADGTAVEWLIGLDGIDRLFTLEHGLPAAAQGEWEAEGVFAIALDEIGSRRKQQITVTFDGPEVTLEATTIAEITDTVTLTGHIEG